MKLKDELKEQAIIECTLDTVYKSGFTGIKMADIAKKVGISPSTLYVYFKNKEDLVISICITLFTQWARNDNQEVFIDLPYKMKLKQKWLSLVNFSLNNAKEMSFIKQLKQSPYFGKMPKDIKLAKYKSGTDLVELGKKEGLIKDIDNAIILSILGYSSEQTVSLVNDKHLKMNEKDMDLMFSILWDALKA